MPAYVAAGYPAPGAEWREGRLDLYHLFGLASEGSFCFRMAGTALINAGVGEGDLLVFSKSIDASTNDIVLARVNGIFYIRRLVLHHDHTFLLPAHPSTPTEPTPRSGALGRAYRPISIKKGRDRFEIQGVALCGLHPLHPQARHRLQPVQRPSLLDLNQTIGLDQPDTFATVVKGSSMQGASIFHGDVLIVSRGLAAQENEIIIASHQGGFVVKRLIQASETVFLLSDHPLVPPIVASAETGFQVWGVVLFCVHPLHPLVKHRLLQHRKPGT